ncbi:amine oxidase-like protein, partial [Aphelenchoides avenae]
MTLLLHIDSVVARDFGLMIQCCGMTSASFTILWMKVAVEWHSLVFCSLGAMFSIVFGLEYVDHVLNGQEKKMLFVALWFAFAMSLLLLNKQHKRKTFITIPDFNAWKALILFSTGLVGGLCSAFAGTGACMCSFIVLTLLFRVSEKVATPTSVVLMTGNTIVGAFWRNLVMTEVSPLTWEYFQVA